MGLMKCKKHGYSGFREVCVHLYEVYEQGVYQEANEIPVLATLICDECAKNVRLDELDDMKGMWLDELNKLPEEEQLICIDRAGEKYDQIERRIACIHCYTETKLKHDRALGIRDPFFVYEKTLLYQDEVTIDKLRAYLMANYNFAPPQADDYRRQHDKEALTILWGNLFRPLSIDIYYVTDHITRHTI